MRTKHAAEKGNKKQQVKPEARELTFETRHSTINSWSWLPTEWWILPLPLSSDH